MAEPFEDMIRSAEKQARRIRNLIKQFNSLKIKFNLLRQENERLLGMISSLGKTEEDLKEEREFIRNICKQFIH